jgi:hypothetical protein
MLNPLWCARRGPENRRPAGTGAPRDAPPPYGRGSIFYATDRLGARDPSIFGFALRRHADLYMSELQV